jgi:hypothetical protein
LPFSRRARVLSLALVIAGLGAGLALLALRPRATVTIGTRFAGPEDTAPVLSPGQPFRALLALGRPIGDVHHVDVELHRLDGGDHLEKLIPVRVTASDDEVMFSFADVTHLVGPLRGDFRLVFAHDGAVLGEGRFSVH